MALRQDFSFWIGETFTYQDTIGGSNITGWTIALNLYDQKGNLLNTISPGTILDPNNVSFVIPKAMAVAMGAGDFWHTVERTDVGAEKVLTYGNVILKAKPPVPLPG